MMKKKASTPTKSSPNSLGDARKTSSTYLEVKVSIGSVNDASLLPNQIMMNPKDMHQFNIKIGSYVIISSVIPNVVLVAWPNKAVQSNQCTLHPCWREYFPSSRQGTTLDTISTEFGRIRRKQCLSIAIKASYVRQGSTIPSNELPEFNIYVRELLADVALQVSHVLVVTWRGISIRLQVMSIKYADEIPIRIIESVAAPYLVDSASSNPSKENPSWQTPSKSSILADLDDCVSVTPLLKTPDISVIASPSAVGVIDSVNSDSSIDFPSIDQNSILLPSGSLSRRVDGTTTRSPMFKSELSVNKPDSSMQTPVSVKSVLFTDNSLEIYIFALISAQSGMHIQFDSLQPNAENYSPSIAPSGADVTRNSNSSCLSGSNICFYGYAKEYALAKTTILRGAFSRETKAASSREETKSIGISYFTKELLRPRKGLLLFGPPGTGKTSMMQKLASEMHAQVFELSSSILLCRDISDAERRLRQVFTDACSHAPSIILLDDVHRLCPHRGDLNGKSEAGSSSTVQVGEQHRSLISSILTLIDGLDSSDNDGVFIIATSANPGAIDSAMRRPGRLDVEIEIGVPSKEDRKLILSGILTRRNILIQPEAIIEDAQHPEVHDRGSNVEALTTQLNSMVIDSDRSDGDMRISNPIDSGYREKAIESIAAVAHGMVGGDIVRVVKEACIISLNKAVARINPVNTTAKRLQFASISQFQSIWEDTDGFRRFAFSDSSLQLTKSDFIQALKLVSPSALREVTVEIPVVRWTDIGGMNSVKQSLREVVEWPLQYPELFESIGVGAPRGVLLYGPPGCSKTLMAKALATESSMNFLAVRGPELLSKWLGESEKAIQQLFARARAASPSIIFFDEIDALASKRGSSNAGVNDRVLSQLLAELDGIQARTQVIVIAATNRPDLLDPALIRPGRIDRKIYVPPPDAESRRQILEINLRRVPIEEAVLGEENLNGLIRISEGFSGAEVVSIVQEAAMVCVESRQNQMGLSDLLAAARAVKPQITPTMLSFYARLSQEYS